MLSENNKKRYLLPLLLFSLLLGVFFAQKTAQATISYRAFYQLENLTDSVNDYDLTNINSSAFVSGKYNLGVQTTSTTYQDLEIGGNDLGITGSSNFSMGGWFKMTAQPSGTWFTLLSRGNSDDNGGNDRRVYYWIAYRDNGGTKTIYISRTRRAVVDNAFEYTTTLTTGTWYHIALTYDGAQVIGYLNGAPIGSVSSAGNGNGDAYTHFSIGTMISGSAQTHMYFSSMVADDVFVSNQAFTQGEIQTISEGYVPPPTNSISFNFPVNATSTPDFDAWRFSWSYATTTISYPALSVKYSQNLSSCFAFNNGSGCFKDTEPVAITGSNLPINKLNRLNAGTYQAEADLIDYYNIIYASSTISFTITGQPAVSTLYVMPTSTASSTEWTLTCDPNANFFVNSLCNVALFLFVPNSDTLNRFSTLGDAIKTKAPVGYFYSIKNALSAINSTTTKAFNLTQYASITDNVFGPLRTGLGIILWLFFGVWLFKRLQHFEL
jgi:hypothetical protein